MIWINAENIKKSPSRLTSSSYVDSQSLNTFTKLLNTENNFNFTVFWATIENLPVCSGFDTEQTGKHVHRSVSGMTLPRGRSGRGLSQCFPNCGARAAPPAPPDVRDLSVYETLFQMLSSFGQVLI